MVLDIAMIAFLRQDPMNKRQARVFALEHAVGSLEASRGMAMFWMEDLNDDDAHKVDSEYREIIDLLWRKRQRIKRGQA